MSSKNLADGAKRFDAWRVDPKTVAIIGIDTDHGEGAHPYRETDTRLDDIRNLAATSPDFLDSIRQRGVDQPVSLRKGRDTDGNRVLEVAFGRRRVMATRIVNEERIAAGLEPYLVPATLRTDASDAEAIATMVVENVHRREDTMMEKARKLQMLTDAGVSDEEAARIFGGVSMTAIRNWKKLGNLDVELEEKVATGELAPSAASDLASLPKDEQVQTFEQIQAEKAKDGDVKGKVTTKDTTRVRREKKGSKAATTYEAPGVKVLRALNERIDRLGLSEDAVKMLRWLTGQGPASDVPGLEDALTSIEVEKQYAVSESQQGLIDDLAKGGPMLEADISKKSAAALAKKGIVEPFTGPDGVLTVRLTKAYCEAKGIDYTVAKKRRSAA